MQLPVRPSRPLIQRPLPIMNKVTTCLMKEQKNLFDALLNVIGASFGWEDVIERMSEVIEDMKHMQQGVELEQRGAVGSGYISPSSKYDLLSGFLQDSAGELPRLHASHPNLRHRPLQYCVCSDVTDRIGSGKQKVMLIADLVFYLYFVKWMLRLIPPLADMATKSTFLSIIEGSLRFLQIVMSH